jgi:hypothetical protein
VKIVNFALTVLAVLLVIIVAINVTLSQANAKISANLMQAQQVINNTRNSEIALRGLTIRVAQASVKDTAMKELLVKHQLRATIEVNGKQQDVP